MTTWPAVSDLDVFGSERDFIHPTTQECLQDRVWDALQENKHFTLVVRECVETFQSKEEIEDCAYRNYPKAVKVLSVKRGSSPLVLFLAVPRLRHVIVEEDIHTVGALAWQNCRQLRIVKLPNTVVRIDESAFRGCHWLNSITAVGCTDFGYKAFADCCSLRQIHAKGGVNTFGGAT